jgi:hypothetical protein
VNEWPVTVVLTVSTDGGSKTFSARGTSTGDGPRLARGLIDAVSSDAVSWTSSWGDQFDKEFWGPTVAPAED